MSRNRTLLTLSLCSLALAQGCDPPSAPADAGAADAPRTHVTQDAGAPADRTLVRKVITYYRWVRTDPPVSGGDGQGVDHGLIHLSLLVEVHRNPRREAWFSVGALGAQIGITQNPHLRAEGSTLTWTLPEDAHNDPRMEIFGGEVRTDEPVRAWLTTQPDAAVQLPLGNTPSMVRLPPAATLPPTATLGQYDTFLVVTIPMRNRRGGRYLVQVLDMNAEPGGFSQNGVMNHLPSRAEIERLTRWMRDPLGAARNRPPPIAMAPIDRS